ncbi:hypothetical protein SUGI_0859380 [Cryptomeria japonica]|nr:hypothetical protein SUGI_0859380 [Cryptomeria japonica]
MKPVGAGYSYRSGSSPTASNLGAGFYCDDMVELGVYDCLFTLEENDCGDSKAVLSIPDNSGSLSTKLKPMVADDNGVVSLDCFKTEITLALEVSVMAVEIEEPKRTFDLENLLRAFAKVLGKGSVGTTYKAVLEESVSDLWTESSLENKGDQEMLLRKVRSREETSRYMLPTISSFPACVSPSYNDSLVEEIVSQKGDNTIEREDESTLGCSSRALYYVAYGVVPFGWESKPETTKHYLNLGEEKLPVAPLCPPRNLQKARSRLKPYLPDSTTDPVEIFFSIFRSYVTTGKITESTILVITEEDSTCISTVEQKVLGEKPIIGINHCVEHIEMKDSSAHNNSNSSMSMATHLNNVVALIEKGVVIVLTNDDFVGRVVSDKGRYLEVHSKVQMGNQMLMTRRYGPQQ